MKPSPSGEIRASPASEQAAVENNVGLKIRYSRRWTQMDTDN